MALYENVFIARQDIAASQVDALIERFEGVITANGGKGKMNFIVYNYGEDYTVPACKFKRSGYTFTGWKNMKNGKIYKTGQFTYEICKYNVSRKNKM